MSALEHLASYLSDPEVRHNCRAVDTVIWECTMAHGSPAFATAVAAHASFHLDAPLCHVHMIQSDDEPYGISAQGLVDLAHERGELPFGKKVQVRDEEGAEVELYISNGDMGLAGDGAAWVLCWVVDQEQHRNPQ